LLQIDNSPWFKNPKDTNKVVLKDYQLLIETETKCETHLFTDYSIDAGIRHFCDNINADLIVISNHHRRPFREFLVGSNVGDLIRSTNRLLLSFDYSLSEVSVK